MSDTVTNTDPTVEEPLDPVVEAYLARRRELVEQKREEERVERAARIAALPPVEADLVPTTANQSLLSVFKPQRRYLLKLFVQRELAVRYQQSFLGLIWSYINPLTQFFIYWVVMGMVMGADRRIENYPIHVFSAFVMVHFFTETFHAGTASIVRNKQLVEKMPLPKEMFPVAAMLVSLYHVLPQLIILLIADVLMGWRPDVGTVYGFLLGIGIVMVLGTALAMLFSVANVYWRDFNSFVSILLNFVRFGCTMIFSYSQLVHVLTKHGLGGFARFYMMNPVGQAVLQFQRAFWVFSTDHPHKMMHQEFPHHLAAEGLIALGCSLVVLVIAQLVFNRFSNRIPEQIG